MSRSSGPSGTSTSFNVNRASTTLSVSAFTAGTRIRQSKRCFNYQPGKSQFVVRTFVMGAAVNGVTKETGYFDGINGICLRQQASGISLVVTSNATGSPVDTVIPQSSWNVDKLDGTGASGLALDLSKVQIMLIDFEWLGAGTVSIGFFINRQLYYANMFHNANILDTVYMSNPNLPLRKVITFSIN